MSSAGKLALLLTLLSCAQAGAQVIRDPGSVQPPKEIPDELEVPPSRSAPLLVRMMIHPITGGMFIGLPIVDTNPNKGTTYGVMPIWVFQNSGERIRHIFAPSFTNNPTFKFEPTARYYYYPTPSAGYFARAAASGRVNQDIIGQMEDLDFLGRGVALGARLAWDIDGTKRFFGLGPNTAQGAETNYTRKTFGYYARLGLPIFKDSGWKFNFAHRLAGERIAGGVMPGLADMSARFPALVPRRFHQDSQIQLFMDYDTRDSAVTTSRGSYLKFLIENSQRGWGSEFAFQRYGIDLRGFVPPPRPSWPTTAAQLRYEQVVGEAPFYLLPALGGKETHRAYGAGRYIDKGMMTATLEERFTVYKVEVSGVTTEIELAPFMGLGTVFGAPRRMARRYLRPLLGTAVRAVARPQVVGSIDIGVGQEGPAVFMDINYSF